MRMYVGDQGVTFLDFDGTLKVQQLRPSVPHEWIDCSDLSGTRGFCDPFSAREIRARLARRRYRGVTLIGSGNYHYVSYFLLSEIPHPFALVLFDHHTDLAGGADEAMRDTPLTCGTWVSWALHRLPRLRRVVIVGAQPPKPAHQLHPGHAEDNALTGTCALSAPDHATHAVTLLDETQVRRHPPRALARKMDRALGGLPVYISIDKDVLRPTDAATEWDAGSLRLATLLYWLVWLRRSRRVVGIDICGEWPASPLDLLSSDVLAQVRKNATANQTILHAVRCG
jgi:arginase family enzyme